MRQASKVICPYLMGRRLGGVKTRCRLFSYVVSGSVRQIRTSAKAHLNPFFIVFLVSYLCRYLYFLTYVKILYKIFNMQKI